VESGEKAAPEKTAQDKAALWLTKGPQGGIWGFTPQGWERFSGRITTQLKAAGVLNREAAMLRHLFLAPAQEATLDKHGRMLVPEALRTWAGLETDVVWVGSGTFFELYGAAKLGLCPVDPPTAADDHA
jgi:MraZ protein